MRYNQFADYAPPTNVGSLRMGGGRCGAGENLCQENSRQRGMTLNLRIVVIYAMDSKKE
jgi:hypothetical protein